MRMLRGTLEAPYEDLNMGDWIVDYASANEEPIKDADHVFKVDFARSPFSMTKHLKAYRQMKKVIAEGNYDAIHTHSPVGSIITRWAAKSAHKKGVKIIYTCHGFQFYEGGPKRDWRLFFPVEKRLARSTDLIITINTEDFEMAKRRFACPVKMIDGAGVDTAKFKKTTKAEQAEARKKYGLDANDFVMVYTAEYTKNKNHEMLIRAAAPIMHENPNVKLLFLGKGETMKAVRTLAKKLGVEKQVVMPGYIRDNYAALVQSCNLCVSASKREGLGLGVLEGVACGLPILVANNRGHRDIVGSNKKLMFDLNDIDGLTKKMRDAMKNPTKYHLDFPERYSLRNSLTQMRKIYRGFLG